MRAAAAQALGSLDTRESLVGLTERLRAEPDGRVRAILAVSMGKLGNKSRTTFELCNSLVEREADATARGALARYLVNHLDEFPEAKPTLHRLVKRETDTRTLAYVAGRLYRAR